MHDVAERYQRVAEDLARIIEAVPDDAWERPAPCEGWVARDVVLHLVEWIPAFFEAAGGPDLPTLGPGGDPLAAWAALDAAIRAALDDPGTAAGPVMHPRAGSHTFAEAIDRFVREDVMLHTWDLATATGQQVRLDPAFVHEALIKLRPMDESLRASGQFGPKVDVPEGSDEQTQLLGFIGRQP